MKHFIEQLENFKQLVYKYHKTLDLISDKGLQKIDEKISDAREYANYIAKSEQLEEIIDIGSGIGLPGIVIAIFLPEVEIYLVERRQRRVAFLKIAVSQLELANCTVHSDDIRTLIKPKVNIITAQAVATFSELYELTKHLHKDRIILVSRKGEDWQSETNALEQNYGTKLSIQETKGLSSHGSLVAVSLSGGLRCLL